MTLDEIHKNKPEGATHYSDFYNHITYYKVNDYIDLWDNVEWTYFDDLENIGIYELKPLY